MSQPTNAAGRRPGPPSTSMSDGGRARPRRPIDSSRSQRRTRSTDDSDDDDDDDYNDNDDNDDGDDDDDGYGSVGSYGSYRSTSSRGQSSRPRPGTVEKPPRGTSDCAEVLAKFHRVPYAVGAKTKINTGPFFYTEDPYEAINAYCVQNNVRFVDREFTPTLLSLIGRVEHSEGTGPAYTERFVEEHKARKWRRPTTYMKPAPEMYHGGVKDNDIIQGVTGNCWFLAMIAAVATKYPETIEGIIRPNTVSQCGAYTLGLFLNGVRCYLLIDDHFLVDDKGVHIFAKSRKDANELYPMVLEKGLAKWAGSYLDSCGSQLFKNVLTPEAVFKAFTGATAYKNTNIKDERPDDLLLRTMKQLIVDGFVLCAGTLPKADRVYGLHGNHAYTVLSVYNAGGTDLVCLRNPWGHGEWQGPWGFNSQEWVRVGLDPRQLNPADVDDNDGIFFMSFKDFRTWFGRFYGVGPGVSFYRPGRESGLRTVSRNYKPLLVREDPNAVVASRDKHRYGHASEVVGCCASCLRMIRDIDFKQLTVRQTLAVAYKLRGREQWTNLRQNFKQKEYFRELGIPLKNDSERTLPPADGVPYVGPHKVDHRLKRAIVTEGGPLGEDTDPGSSSTSSSSSDTY